jgi:carbonic anhydrase
MQQGQSRRAFLGKGLCLGGAALAAGPLTLAAADATTAAPAETPPKTGDEGLKRLLAGNRRFVKGKLEHPGRDAARRVEIAEGQKPFAIVLGCADSRVPPEVVFDQGLGDVFVVRVAGNTANDPLVVGSIEYAATTFGSVVLMVLGHDHCGAVKAAIEVAIKGKTLPGDIGAVVEPILPAVEQVRNAPESELLDQATRLNIQRTVDALKSADSLITELVSSEKLKVVGSEYKLKTGKIDVVVS